jgi:hypothetical protein
MCYTSQASHHFHIVTANQAQNYLVSTIYITVSYMGNTTLVKRQNKTCRLIYESIKIVFHGKLHK